MKFVWLLCILQDSCAADTEPAILEGGKQFGLSRNSHIAVAFDDTKVKNRYVVCFSNEFWWESQDKMPLLILSKVSPKTMDIIWKDHMPWVINFIKQT